MQFRRTRDTAIVSLQGLPKITTTSTSILVQSKTREGTHAHTEEQRGIRWVPLYDWIPDELPFVV